MLTTVPRYTTLHTNTGSTRRTIFTRSRCARITAPMSLYADGFGAACCLIVTEQGGTEAVYDARETMICSLQMLIDTPLDEARRVAETVAARFSAFACGTEVAVGPYHKVDGWQAATVRFRWVEGHITFDELLAIVSAGWESTGPRVA